MSTKQNYFVLLFLSNGVITDVRVTKLAIGESVAESFAKKVLTELPGQLTD